MFGLKVQTHVRSCFVVPGHRDPHSAALVKPDWREESRMAVFRAASSPRTVWGGSACVVAGDSKPESFSFGELSKRLGVGLWN